MIVGLPMAITQFTTAPLAVGADYSYAVLPLFMLIGTMAGITGIAEGAFGSLEKWLGRVKGGLLYTLVMANAAFGACSGISTASSITFARLALPEMNKAGYDRKLSMGAICGSGILSTLIPPSIGIILICVIMNNLSIGTALNYGLSCGLLLIVIMCVGVFVYARLCPDKVPDTTGMDKVPMLRYHNLILTGDAAASLSPETVELGIFQDAVFTEEEIGTAVQKLIDTGWEDMTSVNYEGIAVFFSQPEKDPPTLEEIIAEKQNAPVQISDFDMERARQFIADSGLDTLIYEKTGVTLVLEVDPTRSYVVLYGYKDGMETNTYVRMSFYENGDLAEAKLYAVIPETRTVPMIPIEEAVKNAYGRFLYGGGDNYEEIAVTAVRFEYLDGLPMY